VQKDHIYMKMINCYMNTNDFDFYKNVIYFIQVIESISIHRFVPIFRKHVKLRPQFKMKRIYFIDSFFVSKWYNNIY
jgi:hypothetical protein